MDHNVQTWQVRPTLPRTHEEVVIPETRSPKAPPEPPHPICPSLVCSAPPSMAWGAGGRGGQRDSLVPQARGRSLPPGLLSAAGECPPTARAHTHARTRRGPAPYLAHSPPRDRFCLTCGEEARTGRRISPSSTHLKPSGVHPAPHTPCHTPHNRSPGCPYPGVNFWVPTLPTSWALLRPGPGPSRSPTA